MRSEDSSGTTADDPRSARDGPLADDLSAQERQQAVRQALSEALRLARLQAEVLARLDEADQAGDDEAVLRCHAELDDVMARMAEAERVRAGARAALPQDDDLVCAGCGAAAEPMYETPRLLGYRCTRCDWQGEDPAAQAERRRLEASDAARAAIERTLKSLEDALVILDSPGKRGKKAREAREEGIGALRSLHDDLTAVHTRIRKAR
ncbi:MAG: hypothetical protein J2P25_03625 [Nocardiopsaceae bacterium]|nr:hypothetical protein [Nocardiopsaceae bacterium]